MPYFSEKTRIFRLGNQTRYSIFLIKHFRFCSYTTLANENGRVENFIFGFKVVYLPLRRGTRIFPCKQLHSQNGQFSSNGKHAQFLESLSKVPFERSSNQA